MLWQSDFCVRLFPFSPIFNGQGQETCTVSHVVSYGTSIIITVWIEFILTTCYLKFLPSCYHGTSSTAAVNAASVTTDTTSPYHSSSSPASSHTPSPPTSSALIHAVAAAASPSSSSAALPHPMTPLSYSAAALSAVAAAAASAGGEPYSLAHPNGESWGNIPKLECPFKSW